MNQSPDSNQKTKTDTVQENSANENESVVIYIKPERRAIVAISMFLPIFVDYFAMGSLSTIIPNSLPQFLSTA